MGCGILARRRRTPLTFVENRERSFRAALLNRKELPRVIRTVFCDVRSKLVADELHEFLALVFAADVPQVEYWVRLRRVLIVRAHLSVFEDANVILKYEILHKPEADDLAVVFPCDVMVRVAVLGQKRYELFYGKVRGNGAEEEGLSSTIFNEAHRDNTVADGRVVRRIQSPKIVFDAERELIGIDHLRTGQTFYPFAMVGSARAHTS